MSSFAPSQRRDDTVVLFLTGE